MSSDSFVIAAICFTESPACVNAFAEESNALSFSASCASFSASCVPCSASFASRSASCVPCSASCAPCSASLEFCSASLESCSASLESCSASLESCSASFASRFGLNLLMMHKDCGTKIYLFSYLKVYHMLKIKQFIISPDTMSGAGCERHGRRFTSVAQA